MLQTVITEIKGVLGKAYWLTGVIPAAVIWLLWKLFRLGPEGIQNSLVSLMNNKSEIIPETAMIWLWCLGAGLLLYAVRGYTLNLVRDMPGRLAGWHGLRAWLLSLQRDKLNRVHRDLLACLFESSALDWFQDARCSLDFDEHVPSRYKRTANIALRESARGREVMDNLTNLSPVQVPRPSQKQKNAILEGLCVLRALAAAKTRPEECGQEAKLWHELVQRRYGREVLRELAREQAQLYQGLKRQLDNFPQSETWLKPTALGNRMASLDDYALLRYQINTGVLWSHLQPLLEDDKRKVVGDSQIGLEVAVNLFASIFMLLVLVFLFQAYRLVPWQKGIQGLLEMQWSWWGLARGLGFMAGLALLCRLAYQAALSAADGLMNKISTMIDLYRHTVLKEMGYGEPYLGLRAEAAGFNELNYFFNDGQLPPAKKDAAAPPAPPPPGKPRPRASCRTLFLRYHRRRRCPARRPCLRRGRKIYFP